MIKIKFQKIIELIIQHKIIAVLIFAILVGGGYYGYKYFFSKGIQTLYILAVAEKGTINSIVSGSGQVSVSNQIDIKAKVSGDIVYIGAQNGQEMKKGSLLIQVDSRDAQKTARDAQTNLESVKIAFEKLKQPADILSILQSENALSQAKESKQKLEDDLKKSYDDGFNMIANAFLDLPAVITGLHDVLFNSDFANGQWNMDYYAGAVKIYDDKVSQYRDSARDNYQLAKTAYDINFNDYKTATRYSDGVALQSLLNETYDTTKSIAEAIKSANNLIQFYRDKLTERNLKYDSRADTALTSLNTYTGKTNTHLLNLLSIKDTIKNDQNAIINAQRTIAEKTESLAKLKAGADLLDIQSQELSVKQKENALLDAQEKLSDYYIRAPFAGVAANIKVKIGDSLSANSIVANFITKQKIAEISLNEVDVAKIKVGQKAILTFDAIPNLNISGEVAEIDTIGAVSQGVVSYTIKITFDTQDERVKPGMSVSADIIADTKQNAIIIPNSAIKFQGNSHFIEITNEKNLISKKAAKTTGIILTQPTQTKTVEIGISNDESTEIISGLLEGDIVIVRTILSQPISSAASGQNSLFKLPGIPGGGGKSGGSGANTIR